MCNDSGFVSLNQEMIKGRVYYMLLEKTLNSNKTYKKRLLKMHTRMVG